MGTSLKSPSVTPDTDGRASAASGTFVNSPILRDEGEDDQPTV